LLLPEQYSLLQCVLQLSKAAQHNAHITITQVAPLLLLLL
jgi:hypothetical protein